jgi:4-hydroxy-2-oxoglutarate aldolase
MLTGIFPPIPTPFINDEIAEDKLKENINRWNNTALSGYVVMGSNGESVYLTREEKIRLVAAAAEYADDQKIIIAGTGSDSIKETVLLTNESAKAGAEYALVLTPSYYKSKMTHKAMIDYFTIVADSIQIPLIIYNVPKFTGINISADTVAELSTHENITGIKNSDVNIDEMSAFVNNTPEDFAVLAGTASVLYPSFEVGASGAIAALANIAPHQCVKVYEDYNNGNLEDAAALQETLVEANTAVTAGFGVPGLKAAMDMIGHFGGNPRKPMQPLEDDEREELRQILIRASILTQ